MDKTNKRTKISKTKTAEWQMTVMTLKEEKPSAGHVTLGAIL